MAFTTSDIDAIDDALIEIASGVRVGSVSVNGKSIQYQSTSIENLLSLKTVIQQNLGLTYPRTYAQNGGTDGMV